MLAFFLTFHKPQKTSRTVYSIINSWRKIVRDLALYLFRPFYLFFVKYLLSLRNLPSCHHKLNVFVDSVVHNFYLFCVTVTRSRILGVECGRLLGHFAVQLASLIAWLLAEPARFTVIPALYAGRSIISSILSPTVSSGLSVRPSVLPSDPSNNKSHNYPTRASNPEGDLKNVLLCAVGYCI